MLLILIPVAWLSVMAVVVAVCCMASRGDTVVLVSGSERVEARPSGSTGVAQTQVQSPRSAIAA